MEVLFVGLAVLIALGIIIRNEKKPEIKRPVDADFWDDDDDDDDVRVVLRIEVDDQTWHGAEYCEDDEEEVNDAIKRLWNDFLDSR